MNFICCVDVRQPKVLLKQHSVCLSIWMSVCESKAIYHLISVFNHRSSSGGVLLCCTTVLSQISSIRPQTVANFVDTKYADIFHAILSAIPWWPDPEHCGRLNIKMSYQYIGIPMLKIRWSRDRLIFNMGIPYLGKTVFILRRGPVLSLHRPATPWRLFAWMTIHTTEPTCTQPCFALHTPVQVPDKITVNERVDLEQINSCTYVSQVATVV